LQDAPSLKDVFLQIPLPTRQDVVVASALWIVTHIYN